MVGKYNKNFYIYKFKRILIYSPNKQIKEFIYDPSITEMEQF